MKPAVVGAGTKTTFSFATGGAVTQHHIELSVGSETLSVEVSAEAFATICEAAMAAEEAEAATHQESGENSVAPAQELETTRFHDQKNQLAHDQKPQLTFAEWLTNVNEAEFVQTLKNVALTQPEVTDEVAAFSNKVLESVMSGLCGGVPTQDLEVGVLEALADAPVDPALSVIAVISKCAPVFAFVNPKPIPQPQLGVAPPVLDFHQWQQQHRLGLVGDAGANAPDTITLAGAVSAPVPTPTPNVNDPVPFL